MTTIVLDKDKSMLLLITKGHRHKDVFRNQGEDTMSYIQRCCNFRCYGRVDEEFEKEYPSNVWSIYSTLAELLLTPRALIRAFDDTMKRFNPYTPQEAIISGLSNLTVCDPQKDETYIEFDESLIDKTPKEEYYNYVYPLKPDTIA